MKSTISATYASRHFSDILNRVRYRSEEFIIHRGGEKICRMVPIANPKKFTGADFLRVWQNAPKPDPEYWDDLEDIVKHQGPPQWPSWDES